MIKLYLIDWLSLSIKFLHIIVGIAWIGASFYFNWLENKLQRAGNRDGIAGHLWAVHGGGFYYLEKYNKYPKTLPEPLHWFKWEAYLTWISGFLLLSVVYYLNASSTLLINDSTMNPLYGVGLSVFGLGAIWLIYDFLCKSTVVDKSVIFIGIILVFVTLSAFLYSTIFNPRAVYMQIGAMLGTIMAANVFFVIIPVQKKLVAACIEKAEVSSELGVKGYIRSRHNNYFTLPVLFTMMSIHYPMVYSSTYSWLVLIGVFVVVILIRHYFNLKGVGKAKNSLIGLIVLALLMLIFSLAPSSSNNVNITKINFSEVETIIEQRCASCHSANPTDDAFRVAPNGLALDTEMQINDNKNRIYQRVVATNSMPLNNKTNMTVAERNILAAWFEGVGNE
ncbi:MAG: urate hydroxylase PuuD [Gammaproteobacteria bacterium]|nr:urate hydroxylase PuuD [Gammaproteobacteria bacterium]